MPDIHIRREHALGLEGARKVALQWRDKVQRRFGMSMEGDRGETSDTVDFEVAGVRGQLVVAADHFELVAHVGFLMAAFAPQIRSEIEREIDALLSDAQPAPQGPHAHGTPRSRQTGSAD